MIITAPHRYIRVVSFTLFTVADSSSVLVLGLLQVFCIYCCSTIRLLPHLFRGSRILPLIGCFSLAIRIWGSSDILLVHVLFRFSFQIYSCCYRFFVCFCFCLCLATFSEQFYLALLFHSCRKLCFVNIPMLLVCWVKQTLLLGFICSDRF